MRRGEIWWARVRLPGGSAKGRPVLVVSDDVFNRNERYPKVMVVHLTSVRRLAGTPDWEVDLPKGLAGLPRGSIAKCGEVYTFLKERMERLVGSVPRETMQQVDRALATALGLPMPPAD